MLDLLLIIHPGPPVAHHDRVTRRPRGQPSRAEPMDRLPLSTRRVEFREDLVVIRVTGDVDLGSAPQLALALAGELPPVTVVDLTQVTFLAVAGLRVLVAAMKRASTERRRFGLVADDRLALRVLRMSGVAASIPTFESLSDALRELAAQHTVRD
jgi:anti-anti-sigma factor